MNKFRLFIWAIGTIASIQAFAGSKATCTVIEGQFKNSAIQAKAISLTSGSDDFSLTNADQLNVNIFGEDEALSMKAISVTGNSPRDRGGAQMDFSLATNDAVKAVVLVDRTPAEAYDTKKFDALVVITNTGIDLSIGGSQLLRAQSLVYNVECTGTL